MAQIETKSSLSSAKKWHCLNRNHWHSHSEIIGTVQIEITILKELKKQKVKLSLSEESEWMQYFNEQKQKANELQTQITQTDREIDRMVYDLYGLTDEEIRIVEESVG